MVFRYYPVQIQGKARHSCEADILVVVGTRHIKYRLIETPWENLELVAGRSTENRMMSFQAASLRFSQF